MNKLDEKGLRESAVVIYICDNGWAATSTTLDWPRKQAYTTAPGWGYAMRSKASPYENGIRTPILVSWPGTIEPKRMDGFAHSIDLFPTIAAAAGLDAPEGLPGINLLDKQAVNDRECIFGSMNSSHNITVGDPDSTLQYLWCIEGDWKLLLRYHGKDTTGYRRLHTWDTAPYRLFDLKKDPGEKNDLAVAHPDIVARLKARIEAWRPVGKVLVPVHGAPAGKWIGLDTVPELEAARKEKRKREKDAKGNPRLRLEGASWIWDSKSLKNAHAQFHPAGEWLFVAVHGGWGSSEGAGWPAKCARTASTRNL